MEFLCPTCKKTLCKEAQSYACSLCGQTYPIRQGIACFVTHQERTTAFDASLCAFLANVEKKQFWHRSRQEIIYTFLQKYVPKNIKESHMLDVGCGNGTIVAFLKQKGVPVEGTDPSLAALQFARRNTDAVLYQTDARATPFQSESYDVVGMFDVLEHIAEDEAVLREMFRVCAKGGKIILTVPALPLLWSAFDVASGHKRRYTKKELIAKVERAGFAVEYASFFMFFLLPFVFLSRKCFALARRNETMGNEALRDLVPVPILNSLFFVVMRLENLLLRFLRFPAGSSLVCIAKKP